MIRVLALTLLCSTAMADNCHIQAVQQVIIPPSISYFVGAPVRVQAIVQKQLRSDPDYAEFQQFKAWKAKQKGEAQQINQPVKAKGILSTTCAQCHGKAVAAGGFSFNGTSAISAEHFQKIVTWVSGKVEPPGPKMKGVIKSLIDKRQTAQLLSELIDLQSAKKDD